MTKSKRREVAAQLLRWARWCDRNLDVIYDDWDAEEAGDVAYDAAQCWCEDSVYWFEAREIATGQRAALALCFAAAMVESGDDL